MERSWGELLFCSSVVHQDNLIQAMRVFLETTHGQESKPLFPLPLQIDFLWYLCHVGTNIFFVGISENKYLVSFLVEKSTLLPMLSYELLLFSYKDLLKSLEPEDKFV